MTVWQLLAKQYEDYNRRLVAEVKERGDENTRLREENARLREALEFIRDHTACDVGIAEAEEALEGEAE